MEFQEAAKSFVGRIAQDGFAIVPSVLDDSEILDLAEKIEHSALPHSWAGIRHAMKDRGVVAVAHDARLLQLGQQVLGDDALPFRATLFDKSPRANWLVVWHQDTALPLRERRDTSGWGPWSIKDGIHYAHAPASALESVLALRLHLDDSHANNGPLRVLPSTHILGVLSDKQLHDLSEKIIAVDCLVRRGGIVAMRPLVVHASSKSQSDQPRRVLHIEYAASRSVADNLYLASA